MKNIHDKFVKERLLEKQNAVDFIRISVPPGVLQYLDLDRLMPTQNSFITENMKELFSDIVYQCPLTSGQDAYCSILIEHKSYKDPMVAFQLGSYLFSGYLQQIKNKKPFRVIIPLIFYHHEDRWVFKPVESYFDHFPEVLQPFIPRFETVFFDVKKLPDKTIFDLRNTALITMFITQKHHMNPEELLLKMEKIFESLQTFEERNSFEKNIVYFLLIHKKDDRIIDMLQKNLNKPINQIFMTLYEYAISEGLMKGIQQGIQQGIQEGKIEGKLEEKKDIILALFDDRVSIASIAKYTKLTEEEIRKILAENNRG